MMVARLIQLSAAGSSEPAPVPATARNAISAERTYSLASPDASHTSDTPTQGVFPEQTSTSAAIDGFDTAAPSISAERTPNSASSDSFLTPPRPAPTPRPTPRAEWIGTTHARRLLDVGSENTIKNWVRYGYLRGRRLPNGRTQVLLADVLRIRANPAILEDPSSSAPY